MSFFNKTKPKKNQSEDDIERRAFNRWVVQTDLFRNNSHDISREIVKELKNYNKGGAIGRFLLLHGIAHLAPPLIRSYLVW